MSKPATSSNLMAFLGVFIGWFLVSLTITHCCYFFSYARKRLNRRRARPRRSFEQALADARKMKSSRSINNSSPSAVHPTPPFDSYQADFHAQYDVDGKVRAGFVQLRLMKSKNEGGWCYYDVSGTCADADGFSSITDGRVTREGAGWWLSERKQRGDDDDEDGAHRTIKCFSRGRFDFGAHSFVGTRMTNLGGHGKYLRFQGSNVVKEGGDVLDEKGGEDVRLV